VLIPPNPSPFGHSEQHHPLVSLIPFVDVLREIDQIASICRIFICSEFQGALLRNIVGP
jgi:hypothetical protein